MSCISLCKINQHMPTDAAQGYACMLADTAAPLAMKKMVWSIIFQFCAPGGLCCHEIEQT